jgi:ABC-type multidrug transport system ATPase subunit
MTTIIQTAKLSREFGHFMAVDQLDLSIDEGEIFGLLGPNAAGKSTSIRMLAGILRPSSGTASILGFDLYSQAEQIKRHIGYVAQQFALYPDLTVLENLEFYSGLYGINDAARIRSQLSLYGLGSHAHKSAGLLSGGYKRRLAIACATTHDPELIFLDEPTAGIDPVTRKDLWDLFYDLAVSGKTLFVTTHYMEEAERCNRLAFLSEGRLVAQGSPAEIRAELSDRHVYAGDIAYSPALTRVLMDTPGILLVNQFGSELRIVTDASINVAQLQSIITEGGYTTQQLRPVAPSIEDAFMVLTLNRKP